MGQAAEDPRARGVRVPSAQGFVSPLCLGPQYWKTEHIMAQWLDSVLLTAGTELPMWQ